MRKILLIFLFGFALVLFFAGASVSAQQDEAVSATASSIVLNETEETVEPIILPDSPLYFLKLFKEKVSLWLTFGAEKEVNKYLKLARLRMAEYQKMLEKGNFKNFPGYGENFDKTHLGFAKRTGSRSARGKRIAA